MPSICDHLSESGHLAATHGTSSRTAAASSRSSAAQAASSAAAAAPAYASPRALRSAAPHASALCRSSCRVGWPSGSSGGAPAAAWGASTQHGTRCVRHARGWYSGRRTHSAWGPSCPVPLVRTARRLRDGRVNRRGCGSGPDPVALSEVWVLGCARRERGCGCRRVVVWVVEAVKVHGRDAPRLSGMDAAKRCQESARKLYSTKKALGSPAKNLRNSPRRRRNRRRRLSSRRPATELLSGLGMSAPPSTPPSTSPEGATASGTIAGVFVTLAAAAVLAYSMVVQRHARRSRPRPVWPGCRRGPPG